MFSATFLLLVPVVLHLGRRSDIRPAALAAIGQTVLGALAIVSNVRGLVAVYWLAVARELRGAAALRREPAVA